MSKQVYVKGNSLIVHTRYITESFNKVIVTDKNNPDKRFYQAGYEAIRDPDYLDNSRICGYSVRRLLIVAELLRNKGVDEISFNNFLEGFETGYKQAQDDINKALELSVKKIFEGNL